MSFSTTMISSLEYNFENIAITIVICLFCFFFERDAIPMESLELGENIGEGEFGSVHKAVYMTEEGEEKSVAVKV